MKIKACLGIKLEDRAQLPWSGCVSDQVYIEIEVYKVCPFVLTIWNPRRHPGVPNKDKPTNFENQYFEQKLAYPQNGWSKHKFKCELDRPEKTIRTNFNMYRYTLSYWEMKNFPFPVKSQNWFRKIFTVNYFIFEQKHFDRTFRSAEAPIILSGTIIVRRNLFRKVPLEDFSREKKV